MLDHPSVRPRRKKEVDNKGVSDSLQALLFASRGIRNMIIIVHILKAK